LLVAQSGKCYPHAIECPSLSGSIANGLFQHQSLFVKLDRLPCFAETKVCGSHVVEDLGLVSFAKTTGGKGLHVVTPLKTERLDWPTAKGFARDVCVAMAADHPDRYLVNMSKKLRDGRIFLDYLRNDRMSTAVAPLSPRARPGATVSMPLTWSQVKRGLDPAKFTIRTVPGLLAKTTAWQDYCDSERSLLAAIKRLGT